MNVTVVIFHTCIVQLTVLIMESNINIGQEISEKRTCAKMVNTYYLEIWYSFGADHLPLL